MRQTIRVSPGGQRRPPTQRKLLAGLLLLAAVWLPLPSACGGRTIGEIEDDRAGSGGSGATAGVTGLGGGGRGGTFGRAGVGGSDGAGPLGRGGAGPGGRGPGGRGGVSGAGPGGVAGASGAFGSAGFGAVAGSSSSCNPAFCPTGGDGAKPCCLLPRDVCSVDYGLGCGIEPTCRPASCPGATGMFACCVSLNGPCGFRRTDGVCNPSRPATCNPAFCPSPGFGLPCCVTGDGPCGVDVGMGCQSVVIDGGLATSEDDERDAALDISGR